MMFMPVKLVTVFGKTLPVSMCLLFVCGLATSVMWGGIFNLAAEGLGKYVPMGSGIFMACVFGGFFIPVQGFIADKAGILNAYWLSIALLAYVLVYALVLSKPTKRAEGGRRSRFKVKVKNGRKFLICRTRKFMTNSLPKEILPTR